MGELAWLIRAVHVLAAAFVVGGAALNAWAPARATVRAYEWAFWGALALLVLTGLGNLGALGAALPPATSAWGRRFAFKLVVVTAIVLVGGWRLLLVSQGRTPRAAHVVTASLAAAALVTGVWIAHG